MKKMLLPGIMAVCLVYLSYTNQAIAQEDESTSVHITIKEGGKVTTDTTYELKEGQDPDMVKKMVQHMAGGDDKIMKQEVIIIKKGDDDCDSKELAWEHVAGDDLLNVNDLDLGIDLDSLKGALGSSKLMVLKDEDGMITVKELGEEEDGDNVEVYVIKKGDKDVKVVKKVTVEIEDEAEAGVEKKVEVEVKTEKKKKEMKDK